MAEHFLLVSVNCNSLETALLPFSISTWKPSKFPVIRHRPNISITEIIYRLSLSFILILYVYLAGTPTSSRLEDRERACHRVPFGRLDRSFQDVVTRSVSRDSGNDPVRNYENVSRSLDDNILTTSFLWKDFFLVYSGWQKCETLVSERYLCCSNKC